MRWKLRLVSTRLPASPCASLPSPAPAWARTIDGAQGGTWEAVHLLGSASLDALVGYTGQSRARAPTHTWNTRPLAVVDAGG